MCWSEARVYRMCHRDGVSTPLETQRAGDASFINRIIRLHVVRVEGIDCCCIATWKELFEFTQFVICRGQKSFRRCTCVIVVFMLVNWHLEKPTKHPVLKYWPLTDKSQLTATKPARPPAARGQRRFWAVKSELCCEPPVVTPIYFPGKNLLSFGG